MNTPDQGARRPRIRCPIARQCAVLAALALGVGLSFGSQAQDVACPAPDVDRLFVHGFETPPGGDLAADGPFPTATANGTVLRGVRSIPWAAHVPVGGAAEWPLVLLAPGANVPLAAYESFARHLATHGFIAVRAGPEFSFLSPDHVAMALDLRAVIDAMLQPGALPAPVDGTRLAAGGHSLGGKISIMAAAEDARIRALLLLDPVNSSGAPGSATASVVPEPMGSIALPLAALGQLTDTAGFMPCTPAALNYQVLFDAATSTPRGYEWTIPGAGHFDFASDPDQCGLTCGLCLVPTAPSEQTRSFIRATSLAFLRTHLEVGEPACEWLTGSQVKGGVEIRQRVLP